MNISIAWGTKIITVPRTEMTLLQASPEIRELDLDVFRLDLKSLEDSEAGMAFPDTHRHNTEVTLSGAVYARVVEIINGYTVTFGDGQYAVNAVGANSNIADVMNVNQVSLRTFNAAGLLVTAGSSAPTVQEIDTQLISTHGSGAWTAPTPSQVASQVASDLAATHGSGSWDSEACTTATELIRKLLTNRLELAEGNTQNWILYDDDGVTPLKMWHVKDKSGNSILIAAGAPARRYPI